MSKAETQRPQPEPQEPRRSLWYHLTQSLHKEENDRRRQAEIDAKVPIKRHPADHDAIYPEAPHDPIWDRAKK